MGFLGSWKHLMIHPGVATPKYIFLISCWTGMSYKVSLREETQFRERRLRGNLTREERSTHVNSLAPVRTSAFTLSCITYILPQCTHIRKTRLAGVVVGGITAPRDVHILIPRSCDVLLYMAKGL